MLPKKVKICCAVSLDLSKVKANPSLCLFVRLPHSYKPDSTESLHSHIENVDALTE
jgi:hypothetical protein